MNADAHTEGYIARRGNAVSVGCLASERSREARAGHARTVAEFVAAGAAHLLRGPPWRKGAILRTFMTVTDTTSAEAWDTAPTRAASFLKFVQRHPVWVQAVAEGTAP